MDPAELDKSTYSYSEVRLGTLDDQNLEKRCPLDHGRHNPDPKASLGTLDTLPNELIYMIFAEMDVLSLFHCRRVNQRAMQMINSLRQYRDIMRFLPNGFRGALSIETASSIKCKDLHAALFRKQCEGDSLYQICPCNQLAPFICLVSCRRMCYDCMTAPGDNYCCPLLPEEAQQRWGLEDKDLVDVPRFKSLPGIYTQFQMQCKTRLSILDGPHEIWNAAVRRFDSLEKAAHRDFEEFMDFGNGDERWRLYRPESPVALQEPVYQQYGRIFMKIIFAPWITHDGIVECPLYCKFCFDCSSDLIGSRHRCLAFIEFGKEVFDAECYPGHSRDLCARRY